MQILSTYFAFWGVDAGPRSHKVQSVQSSWSSTKNFNSLGILISEMESVGINRKICLSGSSTRPLPPQTQVTGSIPEDGTKRFAPVGWIVCQTNFSLFTFHIETPLVQKWNISVQLAGYLCFFWHIDVKNQRKALYGYCTSRGRRQEPEWNAGFKGDT